MNDAMQLGDLTVEVVRKRIKNMYLSVHPPQGRVRLAAPKHFSDDVLRAFALGKLAWVRRQQNRIQQAPPPVAPCRYRDGEIHFVWGRACRLSVVERAGAPRVEWEPGASRPLQRAAHGCNGARPLTQASIVSGLADHRCATVPAAGSLTLYIRPRSRFALRRAALEAWYRGQLRAAAEPLIAHWEQQIGVKSRRLFVQRMRSRWGSCNTRAHRIRLNTELARRPPECLEYVIVHELVHLLEPSHNARFKALMDQFLPDWRERKKKLNEWSMASGQGSVAGGK